MEYFDITTIKDFLDELHKEIYIKGIQKDKIAEYLNTLKNYKEKIDTNDKYLDEKTKLANMANFRCSLSTNLIGTNILMIILNLGRFNAFSLLYYALITFLLCVFWEVNNKQAVDLKKELNDLPKYTDDTEAMLKRIDNYESILKKQTTKEVGFEIKEEPQNEFMLANEAISKYLNGEITEIPPYLVNTVIMILKQDLNSECNDLNTLLNLAYYNVKHQDFSRLRKY